MKFSEIKTNNRLQIEYESDNPQTRNIRGIVLSVEKEKIVLVTDFGELMDIYEYRILNITKINFDKYISDTLFEVKNYYNEIYELEKRRKELRLKAPELKNKLYDSSFLAKFNIEGAKNRLDNSINDELLEFKKDNFTFKVFFGANPNNQIELNIRVFNTFEYYNMNDTSDVEKIIRAYAPNVKDLIEKSFSFNLKAKESDKKVVHEKDSIYSVSTLYTIFINVNVNNFLEVRDEIIKGLQKLK